MVAPARSASVWSAASTVAGALGSVPAAHAVDARAALDVDRRRTVTLRVAEAGPLDRATVGADPLPEAAAHGEGDDGGAHVRHLAQDRGDLVGRAVVQEALPHPGVAAPRQQHGALGVAVQGGVGHQLMAARPRRRSGTSMMSSGSRPRPKRPHSASSSRAALVSMSKCTARRSSGASVRAYWQGAHRRHVEAVDEHDDYVAAVGGGPLSLRRPLSRASRPRRRTGGGGG